MQGAHLLKLPESQCVDVDDGSNMTTAPWFLNIHHHFTETKQNKHDNRENKEEKQAFEGVKIFKLNCSSQASDICVCQLLCVDVYILLVPEDTRVLAIMLHFSNFCILVSTVAGYVLHFI